MSAAAEPSSQKTLAFAALLAGAAAIAFSPIFVRLADVSPTASAFWRVALAAAPLWLWVACAPHELAPSRATWRVLAFAGLFFAGDLAVWHLSIAYTSVANSTLESNLAPIFVTFGAWLLWRERVTRLFLAALAVTLLGAALLIGPNVNAGRLTLLGDALGVLTAVFYAGYMLALKSATGATSTARIMAIGTTVAAIALLPCALLTADAMLPQDARGWMVLAGLALVSQVAGQSLIAYGFAHLPASFSSVSLLLQPVLAALYAWAILGEGMGAVQAAGGVIVLAGIWLARRGS
jgi:drug/metabolite transporter (DMT)-like permease